MGAKYDNAVDRESAHEILLKRADAAAKEAAAAEEAEAKAEEEEREFRNARRYDGGSSRSTKTRTTRTRSTKDETFGEAIGSAVIKELKGTTGRRIVRGILGTLFKSR
jgi:hypothetical protein